MKKTLLIVVGALLGTAMLAGDGLAVWLVLTGQRTAQRLAGTPTPPLAAQPRGTLRFIQLGKFVITLADTNTDGPSYVQIGLSFSSYDPKALKAFNAVRPMIKAAVISSIMARAKTVATASKVARQAIMADALADANAIVARQDPKVGPQPFVGAFLTDFLLQ